MSKLIIVCGLPGSGKTTLAKALANQLNIFCLHKDSIKENLYEILQMSTLEDSKVVGKHSAELLIRLAAEQVANDVDLILEAPFTVPEDYLIFNNWVKNYGTDLYAIVCKISPEERQRRFATRPRHQSHHDAERIEQGISYEETNVYDLIPGKQIHVSTDQPVEILVSNITKHLAV